MFLTKVHIQSSACPYGTTVQGQVCFPVRYWKWNHSPVLVIPDDNDANLNIPKFGCSSNFITLELDVCLDRPAIEGSISTPMTVHQMAKKYSIWLGGIRIQHNSLMLMWNQGPRSLTHSILMNPQESTDAGRTRSQMCCCCTSGWQSSGGGAECGKPKGA